MSNKAYDEKVGHLKHAVASDQIMRFYPQSFDVNEIEREQYLVQRENNIHFAMAQDRSNK